ncbi:MAG: serine/threonine protein kinase [Acidobacteriota bacterium]|nr:MAG: serine/threonine protein kinase [Acidobacteriota bacterium]
MNSKDWDIVKIVLEKVIELGPDDRRAALDEMGISPSVRAEIDSLLEFQPLEESFISLPAFAFSEQFAGFEPEPVVAGTTVGGYRILDEIGTGGMGIVYRAERINGEFEMTVALKLLRREFNSSEVRSLFEREKQIQAALDHPNIAKLLDSGTTADGIPYLVMEFIDGTPIDRHCAEHDLPLKSRLLLFSKVAKAVEFAHSKLIVHRDLKPGNILVDATGVPKLLDFGIAKILDPFGTESGEITQTRALTPHFSSPEQFSGEQVTAATDIYNLGLILFTIGTNSRPVPVETSGSETGRRRHRLPIPSGSWPREELETSGKANPPPYPPKRLKGDIETIIGKATRLDPADRYESATALLEDIWRYLDGLPLRARPASLAYKSRKFLGRNRVQTAAALVILSVIMVASIFAFRQASLAEKEAERAVSAMKLAESNAERSRAEEKKAERVTAFVETILSFANPSAYAAGGDYYGDARVVDVVNAMSEKIDEEFADSPEIRAELHHKFAEIYKGASRNARDEKTADFFAQRAFAHADTAYRTRRTVYGDRNELVAKDMFYLWATDTRAFDKSQPQLLMRSIEMMREENPANPNLPEMLSAFAVRLFLVGTREQMLAYLHAAPDELGTSNFEIARNLLKEALDLTNKHESSDTFLEDLRSCNYLILERLIGSEADPEPYRTRCFSDEWTNRTDAKSKQIELARQRVHSSIPGSVEVLRK